MKRMHRRKFLQNCSAAAALVFPFYLRTSDKSGARLPVVGSGPHTYQCIHDWLVPPDGMVWGDTHAVCQDAQEFIYVAHTVHHSSMRGEAVVVYDRQGRFVRAFGEEFRGGGPGLGLGRGDCEGVFFPCGIHRSPNLETTPSPLDV